MAAVEHVRLPPPLLHQWRFAASKSIKRALVGGVGTGKTHGEVYTALHLGTEVHPGLPGAILFPTYAQWRRIGRPTWQRLVPPDLWREAKAEQKIYLANGTVIDILGVDKALERIRGFNWAWALLDEAGTLRDRNAVKMITQRLRVGVPDHRCLGVLTSPYGHRWLREWCEGGNVDLIRASTYDNTFLDDTYLRMLEEEYPPGSPEWRQELLGEFISKLGLVYGDIFSRSLHAASFEGGRGVYRLSVDPGYRASAWLAWEQDRGKWVVTEEWLPEQETTEETARRIRADRGRSPSHVYMDTPSKQNTRTHINDADAIRDVFGKGCRTRILGGVQRSSDWRHKAVISGLRSGVLRVSQKLCLSRITSGERGLVHALQNSEWADDSSRDERRAEKDPLKHVIDALEFGAAILTPPKLARSEDRLLYH